MAGSMLNSTLQISNEASGQDTSAVFLIYVGHATLQTAAPPPDF